MQEKQAREIFPVSITSLNYRLSMKGESCCCRSRRTHCISTSRHLTLYLLVHVRCAWWEMRTQWLGLAIGRPRGKHVQLALSTIVNVRGVEDLLNPAPLKTLLEIVVHSCVRSRRLVRH